MTYLKSLIEKREEVYDEFTKNILDELGEVKAAAAMLLGPDMMERMVWKGVILDKDALTMAGMLEFNIGEKIMMEDGLEVEVTEEMQPILNRIIRVGIPLAMAETGTQQEIVDYLKRMEQEQAAASHMVPIHESQNTSHETVADMAAEFRVTGLTQEQIASMIVYAEQSKGKVN